MPNSKAAPVLAGGRAMPRPNDDRLVAYLDGEIENAERAEIEAWLDRDSAARQTLAGLARSADLVRQAYDQVLREPVPDRLAAAARGEPSVPAGARILAFVPRRRAVARSAATHWRAALPIAASLFGLLVGGSAAYFGVGHFLALGAAGSTAPPAIEA